MGSQSMCGPRFSPGRGFGRNRAVGREIWQGPSQPPRRARAGVRGLYRGRGASKRRIGQPLGLRSDFCQYGIETAANWLNRRVSTAPSD